MNDHHIAWLKVHPWRTKVWLEERLADGFDVHHVDGDHSNNDPSNLILIEASDHIGQHAGVLGEGLKRWRSLPRADHSKGQALYEEKWASSSRSWREFAAETHDSVKPRDASWDQIGAVMCNAAKRYALASGRAWPI